MNVFRREWGAITFVVTILIGAIAVAISLVVAGSHPAPVSTPVPCPSYTPVRGHSNPGAHRHAEGDAEQRDNPDPHGNAGTDARRVADAVQPSAGELPDAAPSADRDAESDTVTHRVGEHDADCGSDTNSAAHGNPDSHAGPEQHTAPHGNPNPDA